MKKIIYLSKWVAICAAMVAILFLIVGVLFGECAIPFFEIEIK